MFIAESLEVPLRVFGSGLIGWHHLSPKHIGDLGELDTKKKSRLIFKTLGKLRENLLELPVEDFEAVADLFGVFYGVEFGGHVSTEFGPSVYIAGVRLRARPGFFPSGVLASISNKERRSLSTCLLLLLRTLHHFQSLCSASGQSLTTVNYLFFCEIKAWTKKKLMRTCFVRFARLK